MTNHPVTRLLPGGRKGDSERVVRASDNIGTLALATAVVFALVGFVWLLFDLIS
jgi:hypothetical protein